MTTKTAGERVSGERALGPGSVSARYYGDVRVLAVASRALTLQVAHPVVGAGVLQHSDFRADPWGRLERTLDTVTPLVYGTPDRARELGAALRRSHRGIVGTDDQGRRYSALDPEAYFWVHATLFDGILTASNTFGPRIPDRHLGPLYREFKVAADLLGCDPGQVPPTFEDYRAFMDRMIDERLEHNRAVRDVASTIRRPVAPPALPDALTAAWPLAWAPVGHVLATTHRVLLPARLRRRWGIEVTRADVARVRILAAAVHNAFRLVPPGQRELPRVRRERARTARALRSGVGASAQGALEPA